MYVQNFMHVHEGFLVGSNWLLKCMLTYQVFISFWYKNAVVLGLSNRGDLHYAMRAPLNLIIGKSKKLMKWSMLFL